MKKSDLLWACRQILDESTVGSLLVSGVSLPRITEMSGRKAFVGEINGQACEIIREALKMLDSPGWFTFEETTNPPRPAAGEEE